MKYGNLKPAPGGTNNATTANKPAGIGCSQETKWNNFFKFLRGPGKKDPLYFSISFFSPKSYYKL